MPVEIERVTTEQTAARMQRQAALKGTATMRIRMRETRHGSPDGRTVHEYVAGEAYDGDTTPPMSDDLAAVFVREGWAEDVTTRETPAKARARKVAGPAEVKTETKDE